MKTINNLLTLRDKISSIDEQIVYLLSQRKKISKEIAIEKILHNYPIKDINRENQLITNLKKIGIQYNLEQEYIVNIFNMIIYHSIQIQKKFFPFPNDKKVTDIKKVSYLGPKGSYSYLATLKYSHQISKDIIKIPTCSFQKVVAMVNENLTNYGILPVENTCSGYIDEVFDLLQKNNLFIVDEIYVPIKHCLLTNVHTKNLNEIKYLYTHIQPLIQCSNFISQFRHWKLKITNSTTAAMEKILFINKNDSAALGSLEGSKLYNLKVLKNNISNKKNNITRFIVLSKQNNYINDVNIHYKTTFIILIKNQYHILNDVLNIFIKKNIVISQINIRPSLLDDLLWDKILFIDVIYNIKLYPIQKITEIIFSLKNLIKILGSYPLNNNLCI
ncbi:chorismate mutase I [Buchnera aphidicola (Nipponaphis monzeni)]|uniref:Bifunctional chorismate mutase/prephenate dehydratase n=1 Tax=Buchnera aphidicola (Nipponaphis monzeni) TaxID=2495405 RepID=A0A455TAI9_9GAMM|nr:prephenate dehydratase domain-containing protein [Buchnera aphidicola]BBI01310.1 chorismate mutase I [Buchnera aphidicola (Nipponaphis monzeni)]